LAGKKQIGRPTKPSPYMQFQKESSIPLFDSPLEHERWSSTSGGGGRILMHGKIESIFPTEGYGFISAGGETGLFFPTALLKDTGLESAKVGTEVSFYVHNTLKGRHISRFVGLETPKIRVRSDEPESGSQSEALKLKVDNKFVKGPIPGVNLGEGKNNPAHQGEAQGLLSEDNRKNILKRAFDILSDLPTGEIERITASAEKRLEKWGNDIPKAAPELYQDRPASEGLPDFLRRVYGSRGYLNGKMTTAHLDIIDTPVARAIRSWVEHHGNLPENIVLPTSRLRPKGTGKKTSPP